MALNGLYYEIITPAITYLSIVIPAPVLRSSSATEGGKAGIQEDAGCRSKIPSSAGIKSGMTEVVYLVASLIVSSGLCG